MILLYKCWSNGNYISCTLSENLWSTLAGANADEKTEASDLDREWNSSVRWSGRMMRSDEKHVTLRDTVEFKCQMKRDRPPTRRWHKQFHIVSNFFSNFEILHFTFYILCTKSLLSHSQSSVLGTGRRGPIFWLQIMFKTIITFWGQYPYWGQVFIGGKIITWQTDGHNLWYLGK